MLEKLSAIGEKIAHHFDGLKTHLSFGAKPNESIETLFDYQTLYGLLPYQEFDDTCDLFMNKHSMGWMCELSPLLGADEETVSILSALLVDVIPDEADCQILQYLSPKIAPIINTLKTARSGQSETRDWLADKRAQFLQQGALSSLSKQGSFILRDIRLFLVISLPVKNENDSKDTLIQLRDDIESSLSSLTIKTRHCDAKELINLMRDVLFPSDDLQPSFAPWNEMEELAAQMLSSEFSFEVLPDRLVVKRADSDKEDWEIRTLSVQDFPEKMAQWKMTDAIGAMFNNAQQVPCPVIVSMNIRTLSKEKAMSKAQIKVGAGDSKAKTNYAKFMPNLGRQIRDWAFIRERLSDNDCLVHVCTKLF